MKKTTTDTVPHREAEVLAGRETSENKKRTMLI